MNLVSLKGCLWTETKWLPLRLRMAAMPATVKESQWFLGFANFYRRFIWVFRFTAAPLISLLKKGQRKIKWNTAAEQSFTQLKEAFTTAPILKHPYPSKPFIVVVEETWVRDMEPDLKCEAKGFSKNLLPAGRNCNMRNRELLVVKLALEMWHHWLEGRNIRLSSTSTPNTLSTSKLPNDWS